MAINKSVDLSEAQSYNNCMRDEELARGELEKSWATYPPAAPQGCTAETKEAHLQSMLNF